MPIPQWMKDDLKFTDEEAKILEPIFTDTRAQALEQGHLRQADYSKKMNELTAAQGKLDTANQKLENEIAEWATMQANGEQATKKQREDMEKAQADVLRLTQAVRRIATDAGMDPEKALEGINVTVKPQKSDEPPPVDLTGYVKKDEIGQQFGSLASMSLRWPAIFARISREHHALLNEDLDGDKVVGEIEKRASTKGNTKSLDPVAVWEELYEIPAKRQAAEKKKFDEAISAAEQRGREAAMSEMVTPGPQMPQGRHAPVFKPLDGKERTSALKRPQPGTTHNAAVTALRTGKYRSGGEGSKTKTA